MNETQYAQYISNITHLTNSIEGEAPSQDLFEILGILNNLDNELYGIRKATKSISISENKLLKHNVIELSSRTGSEVETKSENAREPKYEEQHKRPADDGNGDNDNNNNDNNNRTKKHRKITHQSTASTTQEDKNDKNQCARDPEGLYIQDGVPRALLSQLFSLSSKKLPNIFGKAKLGVLGNTLNKELLSEWDRMCTANQIYVDKSILMRKVFGFSIANSTKKDLGLLALHAPTGSGKTTFLTMMYNFLSIYTANDKKKRLGMFSDHKLFTSAHAYFMGHFAKYPVLFFDMKRIGAVDSAQDFVSKLSDLVVEVLQQYLWVFDGKTDKDFTMTHKPMPKKKHSDKNKRIVSLRKRMFDIQNAQVYDRSLFNVITDALCILIDILSNFLENGRKVSVLIDNYDTPIVHAHRNISVFQDDHSSGSNKHGYSKSQYNDIMDYCGDFYLVLLGEKGRGNKEKIGVRFATGTHSIAQFKDKYESLKDIQITSFDKTLWCQSSNAPPFESVAGLSLIELRDIIDRYVSLNWTFRSSSDARAANVTKKSASINDASTSVSTTGVASFEKFKNDLFWACFQRFRSTPHKVKCRILSIRSVLRFLHLMRTAPMVSDSHHIHLSFWHDGDTTIDELSKKMIVGDPNRYVFRMALHCLMLNYISSQLYVYAKPTNIYIAKKEKGPGTVGFGKLDQEVLSATIDRYKNSVSIVSENNILRTHSAPACEIISNGDFIMMFNSSSITIDVALAALYYSGHLHWTEAGIFGIPNAEAYLGIARLCSKIPACNSVNPKVEVAVQGNLHTQCSAVSSSEFQASLCWIRCRTGLDQGNICRFADLISMGLEKIRETTTKLSTFDSTLFVLSLIQPLAYTEISIDHVNIQPEGTLNFVLRNQYDPNKAKAGSNTIERHKRQPRHIIVSIQIGDHRLPKSSTNEPQKNKSKKKKSKKNKCDSDEPEIESALNLMGGITDAYIDKMLRALDISDGDFYYRIGLDILKGLRFVLVSKRQVLILAGKDSARVVRKPDKFKNKNEFHTLKNFNHILVKATEDGCMCARDKKVSA